MISMCLGSPAARADCEPFGQRTEFPFEGLRVPANAELRVIGFLGAPVQVTFPDTTTQVVAVAEDDVGQRIALPVPLIVGAYALVHEERVVAFEVASDLDEVAPNAPLVTATQSSNFTPPDLLGLGDDCVDSGFRDAVSFTVEGGAIGDVLSLDGAAVAAATDGETSFGLGEARGGTVAYDVRIRDLAGNESPATTVEVWSGCAGGCSSTGSAPIYGLLMLLARRKRSLARPRT